MMELANIDVKEKEIAGNKYYVRPFQPQKALELLGDLQAVVTSSFSLAASSNDNEDEKSSALERNIDFGAVIAGIGQNLKGAALVAFANRIIDKEYVSVQRPGDDGPVKLDKMLSDNVFTGHLKDMLQLMYFVLEVNYADFFENLPDLSGIVQLIGTMKK